MVVAWRTETEKKQERRRLEVCVATTVNTVSSRESCVLETENL